MAKKYLNRITITMYGGFHNALAIDFRISAADYNDIDRGSASWQDVLSAGQKKRLEKHLCGVSGCTCGSYRRALWEVKSDI